MWLWVDWLLIWADIGFHLLYVCASLLEILERKRCMIVKYELILVSNWKRLILLEKFLMKEVLECLFISRSFNDCGLGEENILARVKLNWGIKTSSNVCLLTVIFLYALLDSIFSLFSSLCTRSNECLGSKGLHVVFLSSKQWEYHNDTFKMVFISWLSKRCPVWLLKKQFTNGLFNVLLVECNFF